MNPAANPSLETMMNRERLWYLVVVLGLLLALAGVAGLAIGTRHLPAKAAIVVVGVVAGGAGALAGRSGPRAGGNRR